MGIQNCACWLETTRVYSGLTIVGKYTILTAIKTLSAHNYILNGIYTTCITYLVYLDCRDVHV